MYLICNNIAYLLSKCVHSTIKKNDDVVVDSRSHSLVVICGVYKINFATCYALFFNKK